MGNSLQQFEIDGQKILIEVADIPTQSPAAAGGKYTNTAATSPHAVVAAIATVDVGATLKALVAPVHAALTAMRPDEATVELSLGFGIKGNLFVASGEGNAALKVTAKWKFESQG